MAERDFLRVQIKSVMDGHRPRHPMIDRVTFVPSLIGGLCESHLAMSSCSPATVEKALEHVAALLTWDAETGGIAAHRLQCGQPMTEAQLRTFKRGIENRTTEKERRAQDKKRPLDEAVPRHWRAWLME